MDRRELEELDRFLATVGQTSLYAYYGVPEESDTSDVEAVIKKRRSWAQGQQSNPKFKVEALFLIKQNALIRKALTEEPEDYRAHTASSHAHRNVESFRVYIRGILSEGEFSPTVEKAVRNQGRELGLAEALVSQQIGEALAAAGLSRTTDDETTPQPSMIDFYEALQAEPTSTLEQLEQAYRVRYRWARNLNDLALSAEMLNGLDQAWTVLRDPARRARYDAQRERWSQSGGRRPDGSPGYTPGPTPQGQTAESVASGPFLDMPPPSLAHLPPMPVLPMPVPPMPVLPMPVLPAPVPPQSAAPPRPPPPPRSEPKPLDLSDLEPVRLRGPKLAMDVADTVVLRTGEPKVRHRLIVRNQGDGRMPGRVVADHDWLEIVKPQLDPNLLTQVVEVLVHADRMPRRTASAALTLITEHGERRTITFKVSRRSAVPKALAAGALLLLGFAALVASGVIHGPHTNDAVLTLLLDPPADQVFVNGLVVGNGGTVEYRATNPDAPIRIRVEADGFGAHDELVQLEGGRSIERRIQLELTDAMDWTPPAGATAVALDRTAAKVVQTHATALAACLPIRGAVDAHFKAMVDPTGIARNVELLEPADASPDDRRCIRRVFRTMRFGAVAGDYGEVDTLLRLTGGTP